jgi:exodeoxyribonuclease-3
MKLNIYSWNVNGIRAWHKKGCFEKLLHEKPDIICLQETKARPDQLTPDVLAPKDYYSYFEYPKEKKGYSGVAVYTKIKPEKVEYGLNIEHLDMEGRQIILYFTDFVLINCYFPNGGGESHRLEYKLKYYKAFLVKLNKIREKYKKIVFCGDLNVAHTAIDIERPKENENHVGFLPEERAWVDELVKEGYLDVYRETYPDTVKKYTWWDVKTRSRERNVGWRIDYFFVTKNILGDASNPIIHDEVYGSDHCPISMDLKI